MINFPKSSALPIASEYFNPHLGISKAVAVIQLGLTFSNWAVKENSDSFLISNVIFPFSEGINSPIKLVSEFVILPLIFACFNLKPNNLK